MPRIIPGINIRAGMEGSKLSCSATARIGPVVIQLKYAGEPPDLIHKSDNSRGVGLPGRCGIDTDGESSKIYSSKSSSSTRKIGATP